MQALMQALSLIAFKLGQPQQAKDDYNHFDRTLTIHISYSF